MTKHYSDCAVNNGPAYAPGHCDCGGYPNILEGQHAWLQRRVRRVRHLKTDGLYRIITTARVEADLTPVVVYQSEKDGSVWTRPVAEFTDGRFEPVTD